MRLHAYLHENLNVRFPMMFGTAVLTGRVSKSQMKPDSESAMNITMSMCPTYKA